jgi:hypothetical protein
LGNPKATDPKATDNRKKEKKEFAYKVHKYLMFVAMLLTQ